MVLNHHPHSHVVTHDRPKAASHPQWHLCPRLPHSARPPWRPLLPLSPLTTITSHHRHRPPSPSRLSLIPHSCLPLLCMRNEICPCICICVVRISDFRSTSFTVLCVSSRASATPILTVVTVGGQVAQTLLGNSGVVGLPVAAAGRGSTTKGGNR